MWKASNSHFWALIVALYFLEYGVWQFATEEPGAGIIFTVMALVWVALARMQYRKIRSGTLEQEPVPPRVEG